MRGKIVKKFSVTSSPSDRRAALSKSDFGALLMGSLYQDKRKLCAKCALSFSAIFCLLLGQDSYFRPIDREEARLRAPSTLWRQVALRQSILVRLANQIHLTMPHHPTSRAFRCRIPSTATFILEKTKRLLLCGKVARILRLMVNSFRATLNYGSI